MPVCLVLVLVCVLVHVLVVCFAQPALVVYFSQIVLVAAFLQGSIHMAALVCHFSVDTEVLLEVFHTRGLEGGHLGR